MSETLFRTGIIGATGFIGAPYRAEIRACHQAQMIALCARRKDLLKTAAQEDGAPFYTQSWEEVITHPEVNFVIVATPDALHHEAVMACAKHGKHLLCEKPVGMNASQAREMMQAFLHSDPPLGHFVPFWTRYVKVFQVAREMIQSGELGEIRSTLFRWHNPRPPNMPLTWRDNPELSSAGTIADVGSHAYDTIRWMIGLEAEKVLAHGQRLTHGKPDLGEINLREAIEKGQQTDTASMPSKPGGHFDYASVSCLFSNGASGLFVLSHAGSVRKFLAPEIELHGTKASLSADRYTGKIKLIRQNQELETLHELPPAFEFGNRFEQYVFPALSPMIKGTRSSVPHPTLEDGWLAQRFTDAAYLSAKDGHWRPV